MCAIFGFIAKGDSGPKLSRLRKIIKRNAMTWTTNVDAYGIAWVTANQRMGCFKRQGDFRDNLHILENVRDARVVIGHLRKTTRGTEQQNHNNHPHQFDGAWLIHNGIITNYRELITEWGLNPSTECDTEVRGLIANKVNRPRIHQIETAVNLVDNSAEFSCMIIDHRPARLWVARRGKPITYFSTPEGLYFCSFGGNQVCKRDGEFADNQVVEYIWKRGQGGRRKKAIKTNPYQQPRFDFRNLGNGRPIKTSAATTSSFRDKIVTEINRGQQFHFNEQDLLVYEGDSSDDDRKKITGSVDGEIRVCRKCGSIVTQYADGTYCDCPIHEMDESLFQYDADDDPCPWDGTELVDPAELEQIEDE